MDREETLPGSSPKCRQWIKLKQAECQSDRTVPGGNSGLGRGEWIQPARVRGRVDATIEARRAAGVEWQLPVIICLAMEGGGNPKPRIERLGPPIVKGWLRIPENLGDLSEATRPGGS